MKLIYVAHAFRGLVSNAYRAEMLTAHLNWHIEGAAFICPWLPMVRHWVDSGESRARGLSMDLECVKRCDGLIALSPLLGGVLVEWEVASRKILCDTSIGDVTSVQWLGLHVVQSWIDTF